MSADLIDRLRGLRETTGGPPSGGWRGKQAALGWEVLGLAEALAERIDEGHGPGCSAGASTLPCKCSLADVREALAALERRMDEIGVE